MATTSKKTPPTFGCFSNLFVKFISKTNLPVPVHPPFLDDDDEIPEQITQTETDDKNDNDNGVDVDVVVEVEWQQSNPGIVARLMGLETMPVSTAATHESSSSSAIYRRSRSLNSLQFFPDFDPARAAFHRRNQTSSSASFHEQGRNHSHEFLVKVADEYSETNNSPMKTTELKSGQDESTQPKQPKRPEKRENLNVVKNNRLKGDEKKSSGEKVGMQRRHNTTVNAIKNNKDRNNNAKVGGSGTNVSRRKIKKKTKKTNVEDNVEVDHPSEVSTLSPVSVLDLHHHLEFDSPAPAADDAKVKPTASTSRKSSARRIKLVDDDPTPQKTTTLKSNINDEDPTSEGSSSQQKSVKGEDNAEVVAEYFMGFSDQVFGNAEAQLRKDMTSDIRRYEVFKAQFMEDLCMDLGQEIVEYLLYELTHELITSFKFNGGLEYLISNYN